MKSKEFIIEDYGTLKEQQAWVNLIKRDCKPYLKDIKRIDNYRLYRGMKHIQDAFSKRKIRLNDRTPTDTPQIIHDAINNYFNDAFGAPFRNAMFCSGDYGEIQEYGEGYVIFPIGNYEFVWSPNIEDLYKIWDEYQPEFPDDVDAYKRMAADFVEREIVDKYTNRHMTKAIESGNEVMVRCNEYYAVDVFAFNEIEGLF